MTWIAGFVDAIGYLTLREIYVANMSGNTVGVAIHLAHRDWSQAWRHACPLLAFVPGLIAGDALVELYKRKKRRAPLTPALVAEAAGLGLFIFIAHRSMPPHSIVEPYNQFAYALLVGLLAFSMGLQNGALRRIGGLRDVHTYVTGTLLAAAHGCTNYLFWVSRRLRKLPRRGIGQMLRYSPRHRSLRAASFAALLWILYVLGALCGAIAVSRYGIDVLIFAIAILLLIALVDSIRPAQRQAITNSSSPP